MHRLNRLALVSLCVSFWLIGLGVPEAAAQREFTKWLSGHQLLSWLTFSQPNPVLPLVPTLYTEGFGMEWASISVSSPCGRFLFGSLSAQKLYAGPNRFIAGSDTLDGLGRQRHHSIARSQRLLALPQPAHRSLYWLFPLSSHGFIERPLTYARLDMALEGGQGRVISKGNLLGRHVNRMVTGVRHANGRDFWVLTRDVPTREYVAYYLGPRGLDTIGVRSPSAFQPDSMGGLKFSPDGRWLASPGFAAGGSSGRLSQVLARFDAATGQVSSELVLD